MRFYIETFGCTSNFGNTQDLAEALQEMGHVPSGLEEADMVIVNTCAVTESTERKILRRLRQLEGNRLVIAGCLAAALPDSIRGISCRRSLGVLRESEAAIISELFEDSSALPQEVSHSSPPPSSAPLLSQPSLHATPASSIMAQNLIGIVNVAEGCNGSCSYCIVRKARGRLQSRLPQEIIEEIRSLVAGGTAEVQLAAQDTAAYGQDLGADLAGLLKSAVLIPGNFRLRIGMMNLNNILPLQEDLIGAFKSPKIYKFLHIPVQSGCDDILQRMGRDYRAEDFMAIVDAFRGQYEDITIITDIIAGFPGETENEFNETLRLIERLQPDKVNVTRFSPRPGTQAGELYDMPERIKKDRSRRMTSLWLKIAADRNRRYMGKLLPCVVIEKGKEGTMKARAGNYLGVVVEEEVPLGSEVMVKINGFNSHYVSGMTVHKIAEKV